jgi:hypothetical protein
LWHATGYRWYDLCGVPKPIYSGDHWHIRANFADGMAVLGKEALAVSHGKYAFISRAERRPPEGLPAYAVKGHPLSGRPTIDGDTLDLANRVTGTLQVVDISRVEEPRMLVELQLDEHPSAVVIHNGTPVIPGGYQGLLVWDKPGGLRRPAPETQPSR